MITQETEALASAKSELQKSLDAMTTHSSEHDKSWCNFSRTKLIAVWAPFQAFAVMIIAYQATKTLEVSEELVTSYDKSVYQCGVLTVVYFICACLKDIGILVFYLVYGHPFTGFDQAVFVHLMTIPVDSLVILALSIWGSALLTHQGVKDCRKDTQCNEFLTPFTLNIFLGYVYVIINLIVKPSVYFCYKLCFKYKL